MGQLFSEIQSCFQFLQVSTTPHGAIVIDTAAAGSLPEHFPQPEDLASDTIKPLDEDLATWILQQAVLRQTSALVRLSAGDSPQPVFVHPFCDVVARLGPSRHFCLL